MTNKTDVIIVGAGHNGLVASIVLARKGHKVTVLEDKHVVGGAVRTEFPFKTAPKLGTSTGAYLLGLMQPELMKELGLELPLLRRDPHYFLPTTGKGYLLFGSNEAELKRQFIEFFSEADWKANQAMNAEIAQIREDIAPTWMAEPLSIEDTAEKYVRKELRHHFVKLCRGSIQQYLERWDFKSDLVKAMYAVTDAFSGLDGGYDTPGTGMNFLIHNMCRLPKSGGTWMIVQGGMGTVTTRLAELAKKAGVDIRLNSKVAKIRTQNKVVKGVALENGDEWSADTVVVNGDPFRTLPIIEGGVPADYQQRVDGMRADGSTFKVNMCLKGLPKFTCLPENKGQFGPTIHLLPDESVVLDELKRGYRDVKEGKLAEFPSIEWYIHTTVDPSLQDDGGRHNSALFVEWVPYEIKGSSWEKEESRYVKQLLSICDRFAPGTSDLVQEVFPLHPKKIEQHFGISRGHIHHVDNKFGFADRLPYQTPVDGLFFCSAGCHPAGSVIGSAGYIAGNVVQKSLQ